MNIENQFYVVAHGGTVPRHQL